MRDILMVIASLLALGLCTHVMLESASTEAYDRFCSTTDVELWMKCYNKKRNQPYME